jgi:hypothetical protein
VKYSYLFLFFGGLTLCSAQPKSNGWRGGVTGAVDADSTYIGVFRLRNDVRLIYGAQSGSLQYGSKRASDSPFTGNFNNANDIVGFGITYKIIDFDATFSTGTSTIFNAQNQSLKQFRISGSYTMRKLYFRAFYSDNKGMISNDVGGTFTSQPDVHMVRLGIQATYIFNEQRYSFRSAYFQNELQRKTAGSFLIRAEPFYRSLGTDSRFVPEQYDNIQTYGRQAGLHYLQAPGLLIMPGYGINIVARGGAIFFSPFVLAGPGLAMNIYKSDSGRTTSFNTEFAASVGVNTGYNGEKFYAKVRFTFDANYMPIDPAFFSVRDLSLALVVGYRFKNFENFIPTSFVRVESKK